MADRVIAGKITQALESLGDTSDEVADRLRTAGIKGRRLNGCACPIANLLAREVPETRGEWVMRGYFVDAPYLRMPNGLDVRVPEAVAEFIEEFDGERFPDLEVSDAA